DEYTLAQLQGGLDVLLHQQDRDAGLVDAMDLPADVGHQLRHDALGRLVENDQLRLHHQAARDREHLLLPAGQRAARLARTLLQARKTLQHARLDLQVGLAGQADAEVFIYREVRKNPAPLRHVAYAHPWHLVWRDGIEIRAAEGDLAGAPWRESHDRAQGGCLPHAVTSEEGHCLALVHLHADALQDMQFPVVNVDVREAKHAQAA